MKKTLFILIAILVTVYLILSVLGSGGEYQAEKLLYRAMKAYEKIAVNPDVVPPAMFSAVEKKFQRIPEKYPKTNAAKAAQIALAEFYASNKKYDESVKVLNTIINSAGQDPILLSRVHFLKGNVYERRHQVDKAVAEYGILRDKYKETPLGFQAPLYIGACYDKNGRDADAAKAYEEAVAFYEKIEKEYRGKAVGYLASTFLVQSYANLNKYEEAGKVIEDTIKNYPSNLTYLQYLPKVEAIFVKKLQKPDKAIEIYSTVKEKTTDKKLKEILDKKISDLKNKGK